MGNKADGNARGKKATSSLHNKRTRPTPLRSSPSLVSLPLRPSSTCSSACHGNFFSSTALLSRHRLPCSRPRTVLLRLFFPSYLGFIPSAFFAGRQRGRGKVKERARIARDVMEVIYEIGICSQERTTRARARARENFPRGGRIECREQKGRVDRTRCCERN